MGLPIKLLGGVLLARTPKKQPRVGHRMYGSTSMFASSHRGAYAVSPHLLGIDGVRVNRAVIVIRKRSEPGR